MFHKFKIGDKVRLTKEAHSKLKIGDVVVITQIWGPRMGDFIAVQDELGQYVCLFPWHLEPIAQLENEL